MKNLQNYRLQHIQHTNNSAQADSSNIRRQVFKITSSHSVFRACMAWGIKDTLYMFQLALGALNWQPNGSSSSSECSGYEVSAIMWLAFLRRALSEMFLWLSNHLLCNFNNFGEFVFVFVLKLQYHAVMLNKIISTRLLYSILNMCWLTPKLLNFLI